MAANAKATKEKAGHLQIATIHGFR